MSDGHVTEIPMSNCPAALEIPMSNGHASFLTSEAAGFQHRNGLAAGSPRTHDSRRDHNNVVCDFRGSDLVVGTDSAIL